MQGLEVVANTSRLPSRADLVLGIKYNAITNEFQFPDAEKQNLDDLSESLSDIYPVNAVIWKFSRHFFLAKLSEERAEIVEACRRFMEDRVIRTWPE